MQTVQPTSSSEANDAILRLLSAASEAKSRRIEELEAECQRLRCRVARLARLEGKGSVRLAAARRSRCHAPAR
jgi:hypothetical protein